MREKIIQSAMRQIRRFGLRRFTIDDIVSDLAISKKTVYKYFKSKKEIIGSVVDLHHQMEINNTLKALEIEGIWLDKLNAVIFCHTQSQVPDGLLEELQRYFPEEWKKNDAIAEFKSGQIKKLLSQGVLKGDVRPDINLGVLELALSKTIPALFDYNFLKQQDKSINQAMEEFRDMLLYGILKREEVRDDRA